MPVYKKDFGNTEAEEMVAQLFREKFSFVTKIEKASEFNNQRTKIDYTIFAKD